MPRHKSIYRLPKLKLKPKTIVSIATIVSFVLATISLASLFTHSSILKFWKDLLYENLGWTFIFTPLLFVMVGLVLLKIRWRFAQPNNLIGFAVATIGLMGLSAAASATSGGAVGTFLWQEISSVAGSIFTIFILLFVFFAGVIVLLNISIPELFGYAAKAGSGVGRVAGSIKKPELNLPSINLGGQMKVSGIDEMPRARIANDQLPRKDSPAVLPETLIQNVAGQARIWKYPPLSLLSDKAGSPADRGDVKKNASVIEKTLDSFGIAARVAEVNGGPAVTQYALEISAGTKIQKIANLQNDIAMSLATRTGTVRIEAPIPGKSLVGIEVPNHTLEVVTLKQVVSSPEMSKHKSKLAVCLGRDTASNAMIVDLDKMPHCLVAGTTGSGKSILMHSIISSLLFRNSPEELKLILIDPKRVEMSSYNGVPHLLAPVIVEPEKILSSLKWATAEMDRRYKLFQQVGVRNIQGYNEMSGFQSLPYIVIFIDELADLMMFAPVEVEDCITRLAQLARATGIHLVVATQRPSVDVITGLMKANIPCRIAFNVASLIDSRVILDAPGAEKLLGRGDMLFLPPDASKPMRIQGVFVQEAETNNLVNYLKNMGVAPQYSAEVTEMPVNRVSGKGSRGSMDANGVAEQDDLFEEAVRTVCQYDKASATLLQRRLRVGYARAARIIDELEAAGIVGHGDGSKPRDVLMRNPDDYFAHSANADPPVGA